MSMYEERIRMQEAMKDWPPAFQGVFRAATLAIGDEVRPAAEALVSLIEDWPELDQIGIMALACRENPTLIKMPRVQDWTVKHADTITKLVKG